MRVSEDRGESPFVRPKACLGQLQPVPHVLGITIVSLQGLSDLAIEYTTLQNNQQDHFSNLKTPCASGEKPILFSLIEFSVALSLRRSVAAQQS